MTDNFDHDGWSLFCELLGLKEQDAAFFIGMHKNGLPDEGFGHRLIEIFRSSPRLGVVNPVHDSMPPDMKMQLTALHVKFMKMRKDCEEILGVPFADLRRR